ncbi:hypothetical protein PG991_012691 [Apiospora marii]|uniref:DUF7514 domain-containing protein n=1 Tax=Apiospora marii TaxID=335849 RepID=A0ABR1RAE7_9PEZI
MTTDQKKQPYGAPNLKLATADWGGRPLNEAKSTNNHASDDEISPLSTAVVSRPDPAPGRVSKTVPPPEWDQGRSNKAVATQPDAHLNHAPCTTTTSNGFIAEVRRAVREELFEVIRESQTEDDNGYQGQGPTATEVHASEVTAEWGDLFTSEGHATPRFGQIMRVLSKHIIRKFRPENDALVMTPDGLRRFYVEYQLDNEIYPFIDIFSSEAPGICGRVADFLLYIKCQHHLVQKNEHSRPLVPALTVIGFAQYYMSCILAYPNTEFRRLEKIVADVPSIVVAIGGGGGLSDAKEGRPPPEVLPKVIRRHQLPPGADAKSKQLLDGAFEDLMYELDLLPPVPKKEPPSPPPHVQTTTAAMVPAASSAAPVPPKIATAIDKSDSSSSAPLVHSRSLTRRKYVQPTLLHTIGDDDDANTNKGDKSSESERHRERELERASMSGPRQGFTRLHSWHADHKATTGNGGGGLAGVPHRPASEQQQQRHGGRASQPFSPPHAAVAAASGHADSGTAGGNVPPSPAAVAAGPPRGSVSSNASSSGTSVPDVSSAGHFGFSSSSGMTTPTSASVGSPGGGGGGPASPTVSWNPLQYRPTTTATAAVTESPRSSSIAGGVEKQEPQQQQQKSYHVRWEGVPSPPQQPAYAAPTAATSRSGSSGGSNGGQTIKTERRPSQRHRHHRRFPSSGGNSVVGDDDDGGGSGRGVNGHGKGEETWEEFLRAQKKGESYHPR